MSSLKSFIQPAFRPHIRGATLDKTHRTRCLIQNKRPMQSITVHAICFGPKKDNVLINLEHSITPSDNILMFYYEDLGKRWHYLKTPKDQVFIYQKNALETLKIQAKCLYVRGCHIKENSPMWRQLGDFYYFLNTWPHQMLCAPKSQCSNESKLYQLSRCLKPAARHSTGISIGKSYVIKGSAFFAQSLPKKNCIVKSLSGIRSIVVDQSTYQHWNPKHLHALAVLFQEKVTGHDLRVHVIAEHTFAKRSRTKASVDYRYDPHFFELDNIEHLPNALSTFAFSVTKQEQNPLIGLDFIETQNQYVVLEANPSPGWPAYHDANGITIEPFTKALIDVLKDI